ncbi:MAG: ferric iron uptake transcriptional regulator [Gammaproteobacteria bacterium]|nr:ferric iron uptake transcriptional regulator [Gammaproteobacteria bacterium]
MTRALSAYREADAVDTFALKKAGLKATLPRLRILEFLERSGDRHLSAEDVYRALLDAGEDVGLATIYRVLTQFESAGIVERHNFDGTHSVFEMARGPHHDHMVCLDTGQVIEFFDDEIERRQRAIVALHGFELQDHSLILYVRRKRPE